MKKAIAYTATAILLGFAVMMLPLALETGPPTYQPQLLPPSINTTEGRKALEEQFGLARPSNLVPTSLIIITGLAIALGTYVIVKKRRS